MSALGSLDLGRAPFGHEFACHHETEPVALLRLFEVVRRHQHGSTPVSKFVNHRPERASRQGINARGGLVEEQRARFVHDRRAKGNALLPATRQAARISRYSSKRWLMSAATIAPFNARSEAAIVRLGSWASPAPSAPP